MSNILILKIISKLFKIYILPINSLITSVKILLNEVYNQYEQSLIEQWARIFMNI